MCGRFALGISASEVADVLAGDYFGGAAAVARNERNQEGTEGGNDDDVGQGGSNEATPSGSHQQGAESVTGGVGSTSWIRRLELEEEQNPSTSEEEQATDKTSQSEIRWSSQEAKSGWRPRYNVAPKSGGIVVRRNPREKGVYEIDLLRWGLVPHWTSNPAEDPPSTINAMMESVFEGKPTWRVRDTKRCIVLAQGFYEWLNKGKDKVPHFVKRADGKLMVFAGLYDHCTYKGNFDPVTTYTIITTPVNSQLRFLHSRMPAILESRSDIDTWLSGRTFDDKVRSLVKPFEGRLEFYPVDKGVGKVGNDSKDFIKPVAQKKGSLDSLFKKQAKANAQDSSPSSAPPTTPSSSKNKSKDIDFNSPSSPSSKISTMKKSSTSPVEVKSEEENGMEKKGKGKGLSVVKEREEDGEEEEEKKEVEKEIMNPDEDTKVKTEQFEKIEEEEGNHEKESKGEDVEKTKKKEKKRNVETLELSSSDDGGEEVVSTVPKKKVKKEESSKESSRSPKPKKTVKKTKKEESKPETDAEGNGKLDKFFVQG